MGADLCTRVAAAAPVRRIGSAIVSTTTRCAPACVRSPLSGKRAHRLLDAGWMRILAISDPLALGVPVLATTYALVRPAALDAVTDRLARS